MRNLIVALLLFGFIAPLKAQLAPDNAAKPRHTFGVEGDHFVLDGRPFVIRSGEMHYPRVPREYWRDRLRKARAMGLNAICTYIFWNLHEPRPGVFDFSGNLDIAEFVRIAQEEGLFVIIRPGPYVCTEWDFGGLPAWLLKTDKIKVRSADSRFLQAAAEYIKRVGRELAPYQVTRGGPIIMVQVENEYGSFGSDHAYMNAIRRMIVDAGFNVVLYTSDGANERMLANGTLPDVLSVINYGDGSDPAKEFATFAQFRTGVPRMTGEYWTGWFDHWGAKHETTPPAKAAAGIDWMLSNGVSFNIYMFHGGTNFGFMAGANSSRQEPYQPDTTSYDYDVAIDEAGRPRAKFYAIRDVIAKHLSPGETLPELPAAQPPIDIPRFELNESVSLFDPATLTSLTSWLRGGADTAGIVAGRAPVSTVLHTEAPQPMESLGQSYGLVLYRTLLRNAARQGTLDIGEARDYVSVFANRQHAGNLDRRLSQHEMALNFASKKVELDLLVDNMGRINFGPKLVSERKGLIGPVYLDGNELKGWDMYSLPLDHLEGLKFHSANSTEARNTVSEPTFFRGSFTLAAPGDTFLDMRDWGKGYVFVNGHNVGRFWHIGPQQALFVPGTFLKKGKNEVIVFDTEPKGLHELSGVKDFIWEVQNP